MIEKVLITVSISGIIFSFVWFWKLSEKWKERLLEKISGKKSIISLDLDNLVRFILMISAILIIWMPIIIFISTVFNSTENEENETFKIRSKSYKEFLN